MSELREYKVKFEYPVKGRIIFCDASVILAESKAEAIEIALPDGGKLLSARLMPVKKGKKLFDIGCYEFVDLEVGQAEVNDDGLQINMVDGSRPPIIYKRDIAAMAKDLGMTAKDFK